MLGAASDLGACASAAEQAHEHLSTSRILITGGAGFIGKAIARAVAPHAKDVILLDSLHPDVHGIEPRAPTIPRARFLHDDVTKPLAWQQLVDAATPTVVIHLAAETGTGLSLSEATRHAHVNVVGTTTMLDAFFRSTRKPEHIILASSRAVYGEGEWMVNGRRFYPGLRTRTALLKHEWTPCGETGDAAVPLPSQTGITEPRPTNIYAATKLAQENLLLAWASATDTALSILRLQNVYGPGQSMINSYTGVLALFARHAIKGEPIELYEDGGAIRDFVYIDDAVDAFCKSLARPPDDGLRVVDIGSGSATTLANVATMITARMDGPDPFVSGRFREGDIRAACCDVAAARREIGYAPTYDLETGISRLLDWARAKLECEDVP